MLGQNIGVRVLIGVWILQKKIGHCFGLDENNSRNDVIMCQMGSGRSVNNPSIRDLRGINALYQ